MPRQQAAVRARLIFAAAPFRGSTGGARFNFLLGKPQEANEGSIIFDLFGFPDYSLTDNGKYDRNEAIVDFVHLDILRIVPD